MGIDEGIFQALRPEAMELLDRCQVLAGSAVDGELLGLVHARIADLLGNRAVGKRLPSNTEVQLLSELQTDALEFTEQFVLDVTGVSDADADRVRGHLGDDGAKTFVLAVYLSECTQRLAMMSASLFGSSRAFVGVIAARETGRDDGVGLELQRTWWDYQASVQRGSAVDPVLTELVRLFCARTHNCRMCQTLRLADSRAAGADDAMTAKIDRYKSSDLPERTKVALRIVEAFITLPDGLGPETVSAAHELFSNEELVEICLDVTKWSSQKCLVSLGHDGAENLVTEADGISLFTFDEDGRPRVRQTSSVS